MAAVRPLVTQVMVVEEETVDAATHPLETSEPDTLLLTTTVQPLPKYIPARVSVEPTTAGVVVVTLDKVGSSGNMNMENQYILVSTEFVCNMMLTGKAANLLAVMVTAFAVDTTPLQFTDT